MNDDDSFLPYNEFSFKSPSDDFTVPDEWEPEDFYGGLLNEYDDEDVEYEWDDDEDWLN